MNLKKKIVPVILYDYGITSNKLCFLQNVNQSYPTLFVPCVPLRFIEGAIQRALIKHTLRAKAAGLTLQYLYALVFLVYPQF